MKKLNLKKIAVLATTLAAMSPLHAAQESVDASVIVNNTIDMAVTAPLDFGTVAAFANSNADGALATLQIPSDPALTPTVTNGPSGTARIIELIPGSPAEISVTGAAPNTPLDVTVAAATDALEDPSGNATDGFTMGNFTTYSTLEGNNQSFGYTTDATGALTFNVGATLSTVTPAGGVAGTDAAVAYTDATYTGSFEVTVNY